MDYKVASTKCQHEHHYGGVFDTWTKLAKPWAKWAQGPIGRPNTLADQPGYESARPRTWLTHLYVGSHGRILVLKVVEAERSGRPTTWMAERLSICSKLTLPSHWRLLSTPI
jgi:hypothetical protein